MFVKRSISQVFSGLFVLLFILTQVIPTSALGAWNPTGSLLEPRSGHTATLLLDGRVLVVGGYYQPGAPITGVYRSSAELYDPITNTWSATASMAAVRASHTATLLPIWK